MALGRGPARCRKWASLDATEPQKYGLHRGRYVARDFSEILGRSFATHVSPEWPLFVTLSRLRVVQILAKQGHREEVRTDAGNRESLAEIRVRNRAPQAVLDCPRFPQISQYRPTSSKIVNKCQKWRKMAKNSQKFCKMV